MSGGVNHIIKGKYTIVPQLDKCLKFMAFRGGGVILCRVQSFLSPRIDLNFRHLSSCDTIVPIKLLTYTLN